eukprot:CAMPEP_0184541220 /NCGR_PEP_ID=MMETSP0199_2-20130426/1256_1 /TAXON_ID=1112570 /ORGANISM="Thraustochytrium sp., Strain LLF1b" /LENGTH=67 /DNA_ID=CAMNT_0026934931 /DNA_START=268 /DNA_END=467 /DNA_ORIENTATION=-
MTLSTTSLAPAAISASWLSALFPARFFSTPQPHIATSELSLYFRMAVSTTSPAPAAISATWLSSFTA